MSTYSVTVQCSPGNNYKIEVQAPTQDKAKKVAECQTGDKALGAQRV